MTHTMTTTRGFRTFSRGVVRWLLLGAMALALAACSSSGRVVDHAFGFDVWNSIPEVEVLDYRYGESQLPVNAPDWLVREGKTFHQTVVHGPMRIGTFLYVKWRIKATGEVFEDKVDLRQRLPYDIEDCKVIFDIKGSQLYVYLVTNERRPVDVAPNGPSKYLYLTVKTIYPD